MKRCSRALRCGSVDTISRYVGTYTDSFGETERGRLDLSKDVESQGYQWTARTGSALGENILENISSYASAAPQDGQLNIFMSACRNEMLSLMTPPELSSNGEVR